MKNTYDALESISGIFNTHEDLHQVLDNLGQLGLADNVSVLMSETTRTYYGANWGSYGSGIGTEGFEHHSKLPEGTAAGGIAGGLIGAIIGGLTVVGSIIVPGAGLLVAGPLIGALTGGAIGTAAGGLVGALVGAGIPETEAKFYDDTLKERGNVLVVAHVEKELVPEIRSLFKRCGAQSVQVV